MGRSLLAAIAILALPPSALAADPSAARLEIGVAEAKLAEPFPVSIVVTLPEGTDILPETPGPVLGDLTLLGGSWKDAEIGEGRVVRRFEGTLAAYRTGTIRIPSIAVPLVGSEGPSAAETAETTIEVRGTLPPSEEGAPSPELADLKPPATVPPDYGPFLRALALLAAVLFVAAAGWWAARRFSGRFARVDLDADPFHRMPPDAWAYEALSALLARRLAEEGQEELFHEELARIVKRYLSGRFRVDLAERTTGEIPTALAQAGVSRAEVEEARRLFERADLVKFARESAGPEGCRAVVEAAYRLVDATRPKPASPKEAA